MKSKRRLELELAVFEANCRLYIKDAILRTKADKGADLTEQEISEIESIRTDVLEIAKRLAPYFGMVHYRDTKIKLDYAEYDAENEVHEYKTGVELNFDNSTMRVFDLEKYYPREMVNLALEVLEIPARVGWAKNKPTISKGYTLKPFGNGWEITEDKK